METLHNNPMKMIYVVTKTTMIKAAGSQCKTLSNSIFFSVTNRDIVRNLSLSEFVTAKYTDCVSLVEV